MITLNKKEFGLDLELNITTDLNKVVFKGKGEKIKLDKAIKT